MTETLAPAIMTKKKKYEDETLGSFGKNQVFLGYFPKVLLGGSVEMDLFRQVTF
jgi:hypothetical protein